MSAWRSVTVPAWLPSASVRFRCWLVLGALLPAACGSLPPPPDTAQLPPGVFGPLDQVTQAVQIAQYAFSDPSHTYGDPAAGAQAVLAMDYIAGELNTGPRWAYIPATTQLQLLQARQQTRAAVGIAPGAPSQVVVDSLVNARRNLQTGNQAAAQAALANPAFTLPPAETLKKLSNLPYIQAANVATSRAAESVSSPDNGSDSD